MAAALVTAGCAAGRAFQHGQAAAGAGQWDAAVEYYRRALEAEPDRPEYRIALERAMRRAARAHLAQAAALEAEGNLSGALDGYRRAYALDPSDERAAVQIANLQQRLREQIEAAREPAPIDEMRAQAQRETQPPLLNPASDEPLVLRFTDVNLRTILDSLGDAGGVTVMYDEDFTDRPYSVDWSNVTFDEALTQLLALNGAFHTVVNPTTIVVAPDTAEKRAAYEAQVIRTFYVSHADVETVVDLLNAVVRTPQMPAPPQMVAHVEGNSITARATAPVMGIIERVIAANDKPRAEIVIDVEILEVNQDRAKRYGLDLSQYSVSAIFSPEAAPAGLAAAGGDGQDSATGLFNLNTISRGVSPADFYAAVPTAVVRFLQQDTETRLVAQPQLRGQEGVELTLNLGQDIPIPTTAFTPLAAGGASFNPLTSFQYRPVGVIINMTPRVTFDNEIILDLEVENSTVGPPILVAGQSLPTFGTRNVTTRLRLRDGESNLLAGLLRQEDRQTLKGFPGLLRLPVIKQLFSVNDESVQQTDIVMLLTPRIVRAHQVTQQDVSPIHIGPPRAMGVTGPPPVIAPQAAAGAAPAPSATGDPGDAPDGSVPPAADPRDGAPGAEQPVR